MKLIEFAMIVLLLAVAIYIFDNLRDTSTILSSSATREDIETPLLPVVLDHEKDFFAYGLKPVYEPIKPTTTEQNEKARRFIEMRLTKEQRDQIANAPRDLNLLVKQKAKEFNRKH